MKVYEEGLRKRFNKRSDDQGDSCPPVLYPVKLTPEQIEEIHYRFLTDQSLQIFNSRIVMLMSLFMPSYRQHPNGRLEVMYKPDDVYEIKKIEKLRDDYIKIHYPELIKLGD